MGANMGPGWVAAGGEQCPQGRAGRGMNSIHRGWTGQGPRRAAPVWRRGKRPHYERQGGEHPRAQEWEEEAARKVALPP